MSENFHRRSLRKWLSIVWIVLIALACNLPLITPVPTPPAPDPGLHLEPPAADGSVRGSYLDPSNAQNQSVRFVVSAAGQASFQMDGAPDNENLIVVLDSENTASLTWAGLTLDGQGELNAAEQIALHSLSSSGLQSALAQIPLGAACLDETQISRKQLAALLFPLQMRLKYQVSDRQPLAQELLALLDCGTAAGGEPQRSHIYLSAADPFPVVLGYFPFDAQGALEPQSSLPGLSLALSFNPLSRPELSSTPPVIRDQTGPCGALCRGACGPDCTLNNCALSADYRCEVDENGSNTGKISYLHIYECGLHPACIKHDQCYDDCNQRFGCGTFQAAHCRHGGWLFQDELSDDLYCDVHTVIEENWSDVQGWVDGFGPHPLTQVFIYTDPKLAYQDDLQNCPLPTVPEVVVTQEQVPLVQDLVYTGFVVKNEKQTFELLGSEVVIIVSGEQVSATIEITFKADVKWQQNKSLCTATMNRVYEGQGLLDEPLELTLQLQAHHDDLAGSDCDGVNVPVIASQTLVGTFEQDGSFSGSIRDVWVIYAYQE